MRSNDAGSGRTRGPSARHAEALPDVGRLAGTAAVHLHAGGGRSGAVNRRPGVPHPRRRQSIPAAVQQGQPRWLRNDQDPLVTPGALMVCCGWESARAACPADRILVVRATGAAIRAAAASGSPGAA